MREAVFRDWAYAMGSLLGKSKELLRSVTIVVPIRCVPDKRSRPEDPASVVDEGQPRVLSIVIILCNS